MTSTNTDVVLELEKKRSMSDPSRNDAGSKLYNTKIWLNGNSKLERWIHANSRSMFYMLSEFSENQKGGVFYANIR